MQLCASKFAINKLECLATFQMSCTSCIAVGIDTSTSLIRSQQGIQMEIYNGLKSKSRDLPAKIRLHESCSSMNTAVANDDPKKRKSRSLSKTSVGCT